MRRLHEGKTVVRRWLAECCTFKEQTVALSALRGCDGIPKEDVSKKFTRKLRSTLLYPATIHVLNPDVSQFMKSEVTDEDVTQLVKHLDHYPMHWVMHFAHACEIVGYRHPVLPISSWWIKLYFRMMREGLHVNPETIEQLDDRLADEEEWYPLREDLKVRELHDPDEP